MNTDIAMESADLLEEAKQLQSILTVMSKAIKCSLKKRGLDLPPLRKAEGANLLHNLLAVCDQAKTNHDHNISVEEIDNTAWQPGSDAQSFRQA
ncbi:unnamed protein product [Sphagnum jensenii]